MYDTNTAEIIGAFCYHTPVFVFALASGAVPFRLIDGDTIREKKTSGLLERDAENLVDKLFLWDGFNLIEPAGRPDQTELGHRREAIVEDGKCSRFYNTESCYELSMEYRDLT